MTENYLHELGFGEIPSSGGYTSRTNYPVAWRFRHSHAAKDGAILYAEHPLQVPRCRLSAIPAPLDQHDVFLDVDLDDQAAITQGVAAFFTAHGGQGEPIPPLKSATYRPYTRQL
jgi:hypothetical protein